MKFKNAVVGGLAAILSQFASAQGKVTSIVEPDTYSHTITHLRQLHIDQSHLLPWVIDRKEDGVLDSNTDFVFGTLTDVTDAHFSIINYCLTQESEAQTLYIEGVRTDQETPVKTLPLKYISDKANKIATAAHYIVTGEPTSYDGKTPSDSFLQKRNDYIALGGSQTWLAYNNWIIKNPDVAPPANGHVTPEFQAKRDETLVERVIDDMKKNGLEKGYVLLGSNHNLKGPIEEYNLQNPSTQVKLIEYLPEGVPEKRTNYTFNQEELIKTFNKK